MAGTASLAERARKSGDGEAYDAIAKEGAYRLGLGARISHGSEPDFFVEVVLDPFPDRPLVDPARLEAQASLLERLQRRGYTLSCDDAGVVTCERTLRRGEPRREAAEVSELLPSHRTRDGRRARS